jgi:hypothetical protein
MVRRMGHSLLTLAESAKRTLDHRIVRVASLPLKWRRAGIGTPFSKFGGCDC